MKENQRVKELLAQMLRWFHDVCQEHGLRYYVLGGTMLGAVRHQGFIPWDDDVDVGMPRADYLRFWQWMEQQPPGRYRLELLLAPLAPGDDANAVAKAVLTE